MKRYYFDHAATTPVAPEVIKVITDSLANDFGNVSSTNYFGQQEKLNLRQSRQTLAEAINANLNEVYFTSGATESNNTVIRQSALAWQNKGRHLITTAVEHPSVLRVMEYLAQNGFDVTFLPVNEEGTIELTDFKNALRSDTILVSVMYGNNETGSLMPIKEIGEILKDHQASFHVDATQALGIEKIDVKELGIDFLSASAHKIYGPKGIGLLYKDQKIVIPPLLLGGEQENNFRAGTTNMPLIMGFAAAMKLCNEQNEARWAIMYQEDKKILLDHLKDSGIDFEINGSFDKSLPQILNLWFKGVSSKVLLPLIDLDGYAVAAGSACSAGSAEDSHVLLAMYPNNLSRVRESIRISFGRDNQREDVENLADDLVKRVKHLERKDS
ncbi:cysteine desulfurase family protein [Xylocopilactobacillus apicola]|uniref:cysteine desulfurase n=1 Tax=Xylocopilactobacillus apicola TaxID=2932184 RepID=A0AAU9CW75_9LACO|nr:cysteine desulfurase family protein [Xylocopilactobacillus apicola]BDR58237.1 cysteine desulfurase [Xylocopilactobacillus apicola]